MLKFRAWDRNENEHISWEYLKKISYNQEYYYSNNQGIGFNRDEILSVITDDGLELELFTNYIDVNNNEVYHYDIVIHSYTELIDGNSYNREVIGVVDMQQYSWGIMCTMENGFCFTPFRDMEGNIEVIGNLHKNIDLIGK